MTFTVVISKFLKINKLKIPLAILYILGRKIRYQITVLTGTVTYAGTDANVYIQMFGAKTTTKKLTLDDEKNNFEKGMTDIFEVGSDIV